MAHTVFKVIRVGACTNDYLMVVPLAVCSWGNEASMFTRVVVVVVKGREGGGGGEDEWRGVW